MAKAIQKRTLETRARLIAAAKDIIRENGYEAMRVEEVVLRAGTAKGTFFAHFRDKDALMDLIIGERIDEYLDDLQSLPAPDTPKKMAEALLPLCEFMTSERYVFDVILRYSGAAAQEEIGTIATTFGRQVEILEGWLKTYSYRNDVSSELLAEGIHAFMIQAMALRFCALHNATAINDRLGPYLVAWLQPKSG
ncbi:MAG: TetR/AcrR family transcriptional regulator [Rhizobiaceae bacterium]|nr:TetR/AcrR family transcriptional regulator [Rhizobiaceae bacterium]